MNALPAGDPVNADGVAIVRRFIAEQWPRTTVTQRDDADGRAGLPHPYTVPGLVDGQLTDCFYWDQWYSNRGLLADGLLDQARHNTDNFLHQVRRYGHVPNVNRMGSEGRSQPPMLLRMARDVHAASDDAAWWQQALPILRREYDFWQRERRLPCGLNRYFHSYPAQALPQRFAAVNRRLGFWSEELPADERCRIAAHHTGECESGWDFTPRFRGRCGDHAAVDLNCLLWEYEQAFAAAGLDDADWQQRADDRAANIHALCWDQEAGWFSDYDQTAPGANGILSAVTFFPLWVGLATQEQADRIVDQALPRLLGAHGIATCAADTPRPGRLQWDHPNAWPPLQLWAVQGLARYGHDAMARRIAERFLATVIARFQRTGTLWEKYHAYDDAAALAEEYPTPPLLGWTAGVFCELSHHLDR